MKSGTGVRGATWYTGLVGLAVGAMLTGLLVPFIEGERESASSVATDGFAAGEDASGGFSDTGGGDTADGDPASDDAPVATDGSGGAAPATSSPGATTPTTVGPSSSAPLRATDQGVTASTIKVAFLLLDLGQTGRVGVNTTGVTPKQQQAAIEAYVADINGRGGINGRKIEPFFRVFDVTNPDDQRAACLAATEDAKAFAVVAMPGYANDALLCVTEQHRTPLIATGQAVSREFYNRSQGRLVTLGMAGDRMMRNWVVELDARGLVKGRTIGILSGDAKNARDTIDGALVPALKASGHKVAHVTRLSSDQATAASQIPTEVQQMRTKGVDTVLLTGSFLNSVPWVQTADRQGWRPRYLQSEFSGGTSDFETQGMPASFNGTLAMTGQRYGEWRSKGPEPEFEARCADLYEKRTGDPMPQNNGNDSNNGYPTTMFACGMLRVFEQVAAAAGPELTRTSFVGALQKGLRGPGGFYFQGNFRMGKNDMVDMVRFNRYESACGCWRNVDQPRAVRFR